MRLFAIYLLVFFISSPMKAVEIDSQKNLRTLFTTPYERSLLNKRRMQGDFDSLEQIEASVKSRIPVIVKMQGVVIRKEHKPVVFVNDSNTLKSQRVNNEIDVKAGVEIKEDYRVSMQINEDQVRLKPGQQWNNLKKIVRETYKVKKPDAEKRNEKSNK